MTETNIKIKIETKIAWWYRAFFYPISIFQILTTWSVWVPKSAYSVKVVK